MDIRRIGRHPLCLLAIASAITAAHADGSQGQQGRIEFEGAVVPATESGAVLLTVPAPYIVHAAAETHMESLEAARRRSPPELLDYFAGYAGKDTRVIVTTYD